MRDLAVALLLLLGETSVHVAKNAHISRASQPQCLCACANLAAIPHAFKRDDDDDERGDTTSSSSRSILHMHYSYTQHSASMHAGQMRERGKHKQSDELLHRFPMVGIQNPIHSEKGLHQNEHSTKW